MVANISLAIFCSFCATNGCLWSAHAPYTKQLEYTDSVCIWIVNNFTLRSAALGCRVYKSDTNLMGVVQLLHVYPVVYITYTCMTMQGRSWINLRASQLQLSGDGASGNPGYSAKYCTYTLMDYATDLILKWELSDDDSHCLRWSLLNY